MRAVAVVLFLALSLALPAQSKRSQTFTQAPSETRAAARRLIDAWIDTAKPETLDALAYRSIAFLGTVSEYDVVLDGHRMSTTDAIKNSALTILGMHTVAEDAQAIRNLVYALDEIARGRTYRKVTKR